MQKTIRFEFDRDDLKELLMKECGIAGSSKDLVSVELKFDDDYLEALTLVLKE